MAERLKEEAQKVDTFIFDTILNSTEGEKLRKLYDEWATTYDQVIYSNLLIAVANLGFFSSRGANPKGRINLLFGQIFLKTAGK